jgi:prephenate dehydratase
VTVGAIQGVRGAFSHAAAIEALGDDVDIVECRAFEDLFRTVAEGRATHGIVPVENSLAGSVPRNMDLLLQHTLHVVAEARVRVRLSLAAQPGTQLEDVARVASHPVALEQCRGFFERHPEFEAVAAFDTAGSIKELMEGRADYDAAIGSALAVSLYGASALAHDLEDDRQNYTRFLVVARQPVTVPKDGTKTSLVFQVRHVPGSLHTALGVLRTHGADLTRLESRPIPGRPWEYRFYADLRGPTPQEQLDAISALGGVATEVRVLGQYPEVASAPDSPGAALPPTHGAPTSSRVGEGHTRNTQ